MPIEMERREHKRFPCEIPILHDTSPPDFFHKGIMYNFCKKGLYFESNEYLLKAHEISVSINKPPQRFAQLSLAKIFLSKSCGIENYRVHLFKAAMEQR